jgi:type I restriction enzyme S subunit
VEKKHLKKENKNMASHNLPPNWSWVKLGDVCEKITDGSHYSPKAIAKGFPYVTVKDLENDRINFESCKSITKKDYIKLVENDCKPRKNDVLFSKDGTVGKVCLIDYEKEFVVLSSLAILRPNTKTIFPNYLFHILKSSTFLNQALSKKKGVAIRRIILRDLKELTISLPPLPVQKEIVEKIDELFGDLENGIASLQKAKEQIKHYRQSVLVSAFNGKLIGNGNIDNKTGLPEGWKWQKLGEVTSLTMGQSPPGISYNKKGNGVPLINGPVEFGPNPFSKTIKSKFTTQPTKTCKEKDLIICVRGSTTGRINIAGFDACIGRGVASIRAKLNQAYINNYILSKRNDIYNVGIGSTFPSVSSKKLNDLLVPFAPENKQSQIVEEIEKRFSEAENLETAIDESLQKSEALRQSILKQAFEGKLV